MSSRSSTSEPPTPSFSKPVRSCANCRKTETSMGSFPSCERCKTPYCSRDCQKADWPTHEPNCKERYKFSITIHGDNIPDGLDIEALKKKAEQDGKEFQFIQLPSGQTGGGSKGEKRYIRWSDLVVVIRYLTNARITANDLQKVGSAGTWKTGGKLLVGDRRSQWTEMNPHNSWMRIINHHKRRDIAGVPVLMQAARAMDGRIRCDVEIARCATNMAHPFP